MKSFLDSLKSRGIQVIFYNLRKPVLRSLRGSCTKSEIVHCRSQMEVYAHIDAFCTRRARAATTNPISSTSLRDWKSQSHETL